MWSWFWKLLGFKPKQLPTLPVTMDELDTACIAINSTQLPSFNNMEPNLYQALAKARQEALDPVLPEKLKEAVDITVNKVFPEMFKKNLITKTDLILIGKLDVTKHYKDISDDDWNIVKCFAVKILNDNKITASTSTSGSFISCDCQQILKTIKDVPPPHEIKNAELPVMNSVGIYR